MARPRCWAVMMTTFSLYRYTERAAWLATVEPGPGTPGDQLLGLPATEASARPFVRSPRGDKGSPQCCERGPMRRSSLQGGPERAQRQECRPPFPESLRLRWSWLTDSGGGTEAGPHSLSGAVSEHSARLYPRGMPLPSPNPLPPSLGLRVAPSLASAKHGLRSRPHRVPHPPASVPTSLAAAALVTPVFGPWAAFLPRSPLSAGSPGQARVCGGTPGRLGHRTREWTVNSRKELARAGATTVGQKLGIGWAPGAGEVMALPWPEKSKAGTGGWVGSGLPRGHVAGLCVTNSVSGSAPCRCGDRFGV